MNLTTTNNHGLDQAITDIVLRGDLARLNDNQRAQYIKHLCERLGVDYSTQPFSFITLQGKLVLYGNRNLSDQLRKVRGVSVTDLHKEIVEDVLFITARGRDKTGREDVATGAVSLAGLKGEMRANAFLKCETKAKRRLTLSICGLGMLDETEVDTMRGANLPDVTAMSYGGPGPEDGVQEDGVQIPYGPLAKQMVHRANPEKLLAYVEEIEEKARKLGKPVPSWAAPVIEAANPIIAPLRLARARAGIEGVIVKDVIAKIEAPKKKTVIIPKQESAPPLFEDEQDLPF